MTDSRSTRRRFLHVSGAALLTGLAGCASTGGESTTSTTTETTTAATTTNQTTTNTSTTDSSEDMPGPNHGDDLPTDTEPRDGFPPEFEETPEEMPYDPKGFETTSYEGTEIPLVPTELAYNWYARHEARFVDTRSEQEYDVSHVFGAVLSPAPEGQKRNDPVSEWPKDARIVAYCDCPIHLAVIRAAELIDKGYENVYVIEEGYEEWRDRSLPMAGSDAGRFPDAKTISGKVDSQYAGKTVWAYHDPSGQQEATEISSDGSFELKVRFVNVSDTDSVTVETPDYTVEKPLGELVSGTITEKGDVESNSTDDSASMSALSGFF
ncbi:rhodanese-like domain-containing protein [Halobacteriaceae archaeon GCM10025711]